MTSPTDIAMAALTVTMVALIGAAVAASARRSGRDVRAARRLGLTVSLILALWLGLTAAIAGSGALMAATARPPRWPLLPLVGLLLLFGLGQTSTAKTVLRAAPRRWFVAAQAFRIAVELELLALCLAGRAPRQVTFEGRNFDILVGISAPVVAWLMSRGRISPRVLGAWNVVGLVILAATVRTVATSAPGPLHLDGSGEPFTALTTWPIVWLPSFLVPLAVFLHVASLRTARDG